MPALAALRQFFGAIPDDPFYQPRPPLWHPAVMRDPPELPRGLPPPRPQARLVLLVQPFYPKDPHGSFGKHVLTPSLTLTTLAAATPAPWQVRWWDENLLQGPPPATPVPQVVGLTVHLTFARRAYELAAWFRHRGSKVILGGLHVMSCPEEAEEHADALVLGDGVWGWPEVLRDLEHGRLRQRYEFPFDGDYDREPAPRRELASPGHFLTQASLIATRGCRNRCGFCYLSTRGLRQPKGLRAPADIAGQLARGGEPYGVFLDNNLGADRDYLRALCRALRPTEKIWSGAITLDVTDDPALVREMALAGCTGVFVGFESLADENLAGVRKQGPRVAEYARRVRVFHDHGIQVNGSFVLGFDGDRPDVFQRTAQWIEENRMECATFHILTPYPGTPLFQQMEREGRLRHRNWDLYDTAHAVFRPRHMSPEALEQGYDWLYRRLFSWRGIWRRRPAQALAVPPYLAMAALYKRSNALWRFLIQHRLVHKAWAPLVHLSRWRHLANRKKLLAGEALPVAMAPTPASV